MTGYQQILNAPWPSSLDSLEGVPDVFEPRVKPEERNIAQRWTHDGLAWVAAMLPGTGLAFLIALIAYMISEKVHGAMSQITLAVAPGLIVRNTVGVPAAYEAGLRLCMRAVLRLGIVIMGLTLSIFMVGRDALIGLPVMVCTIATAMISVTLITRWLGLPRRLGTLIAVGTSICGVSAIVATAPIIEADENETSYAAACITIFGLLAMLCYPFLAYHIFDTPKQAGVFFGTAIHDMSQATGAGLSYWLSHKTQPGAESAFNTSVSVKLVRNMWMSLLIPLAGIMYHHGKEASQRVRQKWHQIVPLFVVGFLLMACIRSIGDAGTGQPKAPIADGKAFGLIPQASWFKLGYTKLIVPWILATSMAAVGLGTGLAKLKNLGLKPFSVGLAAAVLVGIVSATLLKIMPHLGIEFFTEGFVMSVEQAPVGNTHTTARGRVREDVRKMILTGKLKPGSRLTQQHLAKKFGVAQSVVRESLLELQASGLVRSVDNLGIFVSDLDSASLIHAYHVREMIEGLAARLCCERASRSDIRSLYEVADKMHEMALSDKTHERGVADRDFHHRTIIISANPLLLSLTDSYQMLNMVVQVLRDHELILNQHRGIVEAIERGDANEAERRAREHVSGSRVTIEQAMEQGKFEPRWVLE